MHQFRAGDTKALCVMIMTMQVRQRAAGGDGEMPAVPITVRQLEAIVRISESLARMQLQVDVTESHVQQAMDLFKSSTMDAVRSGATEGLVGLPARWRCCDRCVHQVAPLYSLQSHYLRQTDLARSV